VRRFVLCNGFDWFRVFFVSLGCFLLVFDELTFFLGCEFFWHLVLGAYIVVKRKMMFLTVLGCDRFVRNYGSDDLFDLTGVAFLGMPAGFNYRIVSKDKILRMEILSPEPYVLIWTNLEDFKHSVVVKRFLDQMDSDRVEMEEDDDEVTELE